MTRCAALCCSLLCLLSLDPSRAFAQERPYVRVFAFTAPPPDGYVTFDVQARTDSLNDLKKRLFGSYKNIPIVVATSRNEADIVVEVLGRESDPKDDDFRLVHVRLTSGNTVMNIDGKDDDGGWGAAAGDAVTQIKRWILANHDQIVERRQSGSPGAN